MTPPDPVEELAIVLYDEEHGVAGLDARENFDAQTFPAQEQQRERAQHYLEAAGVPALLADTQSKDERIAELEGENAQLKRELDHYALAVLGEAHGGTGVASDGGEDGE